MRKPNTRRTTLRMRPAGRAVLLLLAPLLLAAPCWAIFANMGEPVPLDRLLQNVGRYVQQHPRDPRAHYTLGRLHSLGFAREGLEVRVVRQAAQGQNTDTLPQFAPWESILQPRNFPEKPSAAALRHLATSIHHYRQATQLAPRDALSWLGLGWTLEQGAPFAGDVDAPFLPKPARASQQAWLDQALIAYRRAYALELDKDLKKQGFGPQEDTDISLEAGEGILRILDRRTLTPAQKTEAERVRASVKRLQDKPRAITPIIFPLDGRAPLAALLAPETVVAFDLAGDGGGARWPWLNARAGILVWDPERTGRIVSGRQLFGSVTWWMFWSDGYEPLAALDDDRDGWLSGRELDGLAVWRDANSNALSEPGEVLPLADLAIARIAVRATTRHDGALANPRGLQRHDGTFLPTYDWRPTSLPRTPRGAGR